MGRPPPVAYDVVLAVFDDHGRGIVQTGLAVQCQDRDGENTRGGGNNDRRDAGHETHDGGIIAATRRMLRMAH